METSHGLVSVVSPSQSEPFNEGGGLVHDLYLVRCPFPQLTGQGVHSVHSVHLPFTEV